MWILYVGGALACRGGAGVISNCLLSWLQGRKEWVELNSQIVSSLPADEEHARVVKAEIRADQAEQQAMEAKKQSDQAKQTIVQVSEMVVMIKYIRLHVAHIISES